MSSMARGLVSYSSIPETSRTGQIAENSKARPGHVLRIEVKSLALLALLTELSLCHSATSMDFGSSAFVLSFVTPVLHTHTSLYAV